MTLRYKFIYLFNEEAALKKKQQIFEGNIKQRNFLHKYIIIFKFKIDV